MAKRFLFLLLLVSPAAFSAMYKQIDPITGHITFTNLAPHDAARDVEKSTTSTPLPAPKSSAAPVNFPRITQDAQRQRDEERRKILEQELSVEKSDLQRATAAHRPEEDIHRHKVNIEALEREIGSLK